MKNIDDTSEGKRTSKKRDSFFKRMLTRIRNFATAVAPLTYTYESPKHLIGLPLLSINLGPDTPQGRMRHAKGIVAIGTQATGVIAIGVFVARGVFAIAFLTLGLAGVSIAGIGIVTVSAFGLGIVSVSAVAIGYLAVGVLAVGFKAVGIVAIGLEAMGIIGIGKTVNAAFPIQR